MKYGTAYSQVAIVLVLRFLIIFEENSNFNENLKSVSNTTGNALYMALHELFIMMKTLLVSFKLRITS